MAILQRTLQSVVAVTGNCPIGYSPPYARPAERRSTNTPAPIAAQQFAAAGIHTGVYRRSLEKKITAVSNLRPREHWASVLFKTPRALCTLYSVTDLRPETTAVLHSHGFVQRIAYTGSPGIAPGVLYGQDTQQVRWVE